MQPNVEDTERKRLLAILDFWHKIEFFIPYDLSARTIPDKGRSVFWLHAKTLDDDGTALSRPSVPEDKQITGFTLFLGVFSKSEIAGIRKHFDNPVSDIAEYEDAERGSLDGETCFASLQLTPAGQPMFETFSVSTLPWALGRVCKAGLASLSLKAFAGAKQQLSESLQNFRAQRHLRYASSEDTTDPPIDAAEILALHELLSDWAGFATQPEKPVALVEIRFTTNRTQPSCRRRRTAMYRAPTNRKRMTAQLFKTTLVSSTASSSRISNRRWPVSRTASSPSR